MQFVVLVYIQKYSNRSSFKFEFLRASPKFFFFLSINDIIITVINLLLLFYTLKQNGIGHDWCIGETRHLAMGNNEFFMQTLIMFHCKDEKKGTFKWPPYIHNLYMMIIQSSIFTSVISFSFPSFSFFVLNSVQRYTINYIHIYIYLLQIFVKPLQIHPIK